jgi:hypothetical protein
LVNHTLKVNVSCLNSTHAHILSPTLALQLPSDSPAVLLSKLDTYVDTVSSDRSIAAAINFQATATPFAAVHCRCHRPRQTVGREDVN